MCSINMQSVIFLVVLVVCLVEAKPYQYAYYISLPGQYQSLEVSDGANLISHPTSRNLQPNPTFRNGRNNPGFQPSPFDRQNPAFRGGRTNPEFQPSPFDLQNPAFRGGRTNPEFQPSPFDQQKPTLNRRPEVPFYRGIPDGQLDPLYNTPQINYQPNDLRPRNYDPYYSGQRRSEFPTSDSFTPYGKLTSDRNSQSDQEFGEEEKFTRSVPPTEDNNEEREEVTTEEPCSFCGVERVNPKDEIDGTADPDSESIEPKNVGVSPQPPFAIANNVVTPGFGIPYYVIL